jgi:hypothetical protein
MMARCPTFFIACFTTVLMIAVGFPLRAQPDMMLLEQAATPHDEVVLGLDGVHLMLLVHSDGESGRWLEAETRMARLDGAPWTATLPEVWGHVPQRNEAWEELGDIVHLDIDPEWGMAVITLHSEGAGRVMFSGKTGRDNPVWGRPWNVPALSRFSGNCGFAVFDAHPDREGDLLVSLRPRMKGGAETLLPASGEWKGGYDLARIPRKGGYTDVLLLDAINSPAHEMALVPGPDGGGWLSAERLRGAGGLDPWWVPVIPKGSEAAGPQDAGMLAGHTLRVNCGGQTVLNAAWQVRCDGVPLSQLHSDDRGDVDLSGLSADRRYGFEWAGQIPDFCAEAVAEWRDADGRLLRRMKLSGSSWSLSLLTTMPLGGWRAMRGDRSRLPRVTMASEGGHGDVQGPKGHEIAALAAGSTSKQPADWVVFHGVGEMALSPQDRIHIRTLAVQLKGRPEDVIRISGHASIDGDPKANSTLAAERARHVAAQLEFAGLQAAQIRFEGMGTSQPLRVCPPGVVCPEDILERSRRTELHIESGKRGDGRAMQ